MIINFTFIFTTFHISPLICLIGIVFSIILYGLNIHLDKAVHEFDQNVGDAQIEADIVIANQHALKLDITYSPQIQKLHKPYEYNPVKGLVESINLWDKRNIRTLKTNMTINIIRQLIIAALILYLYNDRSLIIFIIINGSKLFGFLDSIRGIIEITNISKSRTIASFNMLDELSKLSISNKNNNSDFRKEGMLLDIQIIGLNRVVTHDVRLYYDGIIKINSKQDRIILLDGNKGAGKSLTMDTLAGFYDGHVTKLYVNGKIVPDELRSLGNHRLYVRQCLMDEYRDNQFNTIIMSIDQLFPNNLLNDIEIFLKNFGIDYHRLVSKIANRNERSLSPGEIQSVLLASQIWKAIKLNVRLLFLDEPERNIDFHSVKRIFKSILGTFKGTIVLITHSTELKRQLEPYITQRWNFKKFANNMTFDIYN